jgi:hypothetical protein
LALAALGEWRAVQQPVLALIQYFQPLPQQAGATVLDFPITPRAMVVQVAVETLTLP